MRFYREIFKSEKLIPDIFPTQSLAKPLKLTVSDLNSPFSLVLLDSSLYYSFKMSSSLLYICFRYSIGYPVVTLGFGFKSYVGFRMRLRRQKEVQKENEYYYEFLREALPPGVKEEAFNFNPQPSPKPCSEDR